MGPRTEIAAYKLEYSLRPDEQGGAIVEGKITQSEVSPDFRMLVPVFVEWSGKKVRIAQVAVAGNSTSPFRATLGAKPARVLLNANEDVLTK